jgi:hypothetical protein
MHNQVILNGHDIGYVRFGAGTRLDRGANISLPYNGERIDVVIEDAAALEDGASVVECSLANAFDMDHWPPRRPK